MLDCQCQACPYITASTHAILGFTAENDAGRMLRHPQDHGKVMVLVHSLLCARCQPSLSIATTALAIELNGSSYNAGDMHNRRTSKP